MDHTKSERLVHECTCSDCQRDPDGKVAQEHRAINRLVAATDERNRRQLVGLLARQRGRGGIALLARITGMSRTTILYGQRELYQPRWIVPGRIRRPGAGRPRVEKKVLPS